MWILYLQKQFSAQQLNERTTLFHWKRHNNKKCHSHSHPSAARGQAKFPLELQELHTLIQRYRF